MSSRFERANMENDILHINKVFKLKPLKWRYDHIVNEYADKHPSITMLSLREKYKQIRGSNRASIREQKNIIKQMNNVWMAESEAGPIITEEELDEKKKLRDYVFRYYRHKFNEAINADNTILLHESFQLLHLVYDNPDGIDYRKRWISLITASTQSGKTFLTIALSHIYTALGYDSIFIVKDTSQKTQFMSRKIDDSKELQKALKKAGFSEGSIRLFNKPLYHDSSMGSSKKFMNQLRATLNRTERRSIICIHNYIHLQRIYNNITPQTKIILFVDEAHKLGAYKKLGNNTEYTTSTDKDENSYDRLYLNIKAFSHKIFLITATPQRIIIAEPELYSNGIVIVPEGKDYCGLDKWSISLIPSRKDEKYIEFNHPNTAGKVITSKIPVSFLNTMASLSDLEPIERINRFNIQDHHPINLMAKFEITNEGQHMLLQAMKPDAQVLSPEHQKIIDTKWCVMVFNMHGIRLYDDSLRNETIEICDRTFIDIYDSGEFLFPRDLVQIEDVWHWLWSHGGVSRFPRMVTFSYKSAAEGITFGSKWGSTPETCGNIHLTDIYSRMGETASADAVEQSSGRINGNHGDKDIRGNVMRGTIWMCLSEKKKLIKGFNLQRQQIKEICNLKFAANDGRVLDHLEGYQVFSNRVPKNYYGEIKGAQKTFITISNPYANIEEESFVRDKRTLSNLQMINPNKYGHRRRRKLIARFLQKENESKENKSSGEILIDRAKLPPNRRYLYDYAVEHLGKNIGMWVKKSDIFRKQTYQNITWHWFTNKKYHKNGSKGLFMRQVNRYYELKYIN